MPPTETVSICGLDLLDGSMCKDPADGPGQPCKKHKLAPPQTLSAVRSHGRFELIGVVEQILLDQQKAGRIIVSTGDLTTTATAIIDQLSTHVVLKVLSGMAVPPT